jgi:hypothetical protein
MQAVTCTLDRQILGKETPGQTTAQNRGWSLVSHRVQQKFRDTIQTFFGGSCFLAWLSLGVLWLMQAIHAHVAGILHVIDRRKSGSMTHSITWNLFEHQRHSEKR